MNSKSKEYYDYMRINIKRFEDPKNWDKALKELEELKKCHKASL